MLDSIRLKENLMKELYILEDESNPNTSKVNTIWPKTVLDQVYDQNTATNKSLRQILEELSENITNHGILEINFPVTSVNDMVGDVTITKETLGLENVSNIPDEEKSLSDKQRNTILDILNNYNFQSKIDFTDYENHISNTNNPHHVTIEQIDKDNALKLFVTNLIYAHNTSDDLNIHPDIRQNLAKLWKHVDKTNKEFENKLNSARELFIHHYDDPLAHMLLFKQKENISNKVSTITEDNLNDVYYPSTLAIDNYINQKLDTFNETLPKIQNWYDEIITVNTRLDLPDAEELRLHKFYIIRFGDNNNTEVAFCKLNENNFYEWDISSIGAFSVIDNKYLRNDDNGLTLDISKVAEDLLRDEAFKNLITDAITESFPDVISNYYTKDEIDSKHYINNIKFLQGIDNGTFRYYINDDPSTMSPDVLVRGLQRIAFLEYVTEHEIYDQSIHERHILSRSLTTRHFQERTIYPEFLASRNTDILLGNLNNTNGKVDEIPISNIINRLATSDELKNTITEITSNLVSSDELANLVKGIFNELLSSDAFKNAVKNVLSEVMVEFTIDDLTTAIQNALNNTPITSSYDLILELLSNFDELSIRDIVERALRDTPISSIDPIENALSIIDDETLRDIIARSLINTPISISEDMIGISLNNMDDEKLKDLIIDTLENTPVSDE